MNCISAFVNKNGVIEMEHPLDLLHVVQSCERLRVNVSHPKHLTLEIFPRCIAHLVLCVCAAIQLRPHTSPCLPIYWH
jgi:hypothetical protein